MGFLLLPLNNGYPPLFHKAFPEAGLAFQVGKARTLCSQAQLTHVTPGLAPTLLKCSPRPEGQRSPSLRCSQLAATLHPLPPHTSGWTRARRSPRGSERSSPKTSPALCSWRAVPRRSSLPTRRKPRRQTCRPSGHRDETQVTWSLWVFQSARSSTNFPSAYRQRNSFLS